MATKNNPTGAAPVEGAPATTELITIEKLRTKHKTRAATFAGVCAAKGWRPGKQITEADYVAAVAEFNGAAIDGRPRPGKSEVKR